MSSGAPLATQLMTIPDFSQRTKLSIRTVRTLIALGKIPVVRVSARALRITEADLAEFIAARRVAK
jgi:excisionase family DNA binding protein